MRRAIPPPRSGGLILSYRCNAACRHCMYACGPAWKGDWIAEGDLRAILEQLAPWIEPAPGGPGAMGLNHGLHFTGGEPFLNFPLLCRAVEIARELGIPSSFVETNGFWARDEDAAREKLLALRERGLVGILISVNPFYLEYVPFERTERSIRIALEVFGPNVAVYQADFYYRFRAMGIRGRMPIEGLLARERPEDLFRHVEFFLSGRAPYALPGIAEGRLARLFPRSPARSFFGTPCAPPFLRSWHNHFDNDGNYMPGYCGGISLGDVRRLDRLLREGIDGEARPVLDLLAEGDMEGLLSLAEAHGYREPPEGYFSRCHLCADLRRYLVRTGQFAELAPRPFYEQIGGG